MNKISKRYELNEELITKLIQIKTHKNEELKRSGVTTKVSEKQIVEEAISLYHSSIFGKDVFSNTINKLETIVGNRVAKVMDEYNNVNAKAWQGLLNENRKVKEILLLLIQSANILPEDADQLISVVMNNSRIEELLSAAMKTKEGWINE